MPTTRSSRSPIWWRRAWCAAASAWPSSSRRCSPTRPSSGLCDRVDYEIDPRSTFPRHYTGEVQIALKDGRTLVHREAMNRGCADRPLSNAEIADKFAGNARLSLSARQADAVREAVLGLDAAGDARPAIDRICQAIPR